jgi:hypothetical protein
LKNKPWRRYRGSSAERLSAIKPQRPWNFLLDGGTVDGGVRLKKKVFSEKETPWPKHTKLGSRGDRSVAPYGIGIYAKNASIFRALNG